MSLQKEIKTFEAVHISRRSDLAFFDKYALISELIGQIRHDPDAFQFETIQRPDGKYEHKAQIQIFKTSTK